MSKISDFFGLGKPIIKNETPAQMMPAGGSFSPTNLPDALPHLSRISRYGALMSSDFLACETVKARALRSLPVSIVKRESNGRRKVDNHEMSAVLHRPNALMSWGDMVAWAMLRSDVLGTTYIRVIRGSIRGDVRELRPVLSHVRHSFDRLTGVATYEGGRDYFNEPWKCREDDVIVIKTDVSENGGVDGRSIADLAADDIGLSIDLSRFYRSLLENGNHFPGWLETDTKLGDDDIVAVRNSLNATRGPENAGQVRIFDRGLKYKDVQLALDGMDLVSQERFVLEKICRATHVDMHHVYADDKAAATTAAGSDIDFVKNTVVPEVKKFEDGFQPALDRAVSLGGSDSGYRLKIDVNGLLRGDFTTRMEGYRIGVYAGIFTRAYCATQEDIPWLPGQDKLMQPTAYYVLDEDGNPTLPNQATSGTSGQSDGVSGIDEKEAKNAIGALQPVINDASTRIEKRAAVDGDCEKTRTFAATVLAPIELAAAHAGEFLPTNEIINEAIQRGTKND